MEGKYHMKRMIAATLTLALTTAALAGCAANAAAPTDDQNTVAAATMSNETGKTPKYVFLFIGDGMSYPQIQSTADYLGALKDTDYFQAQPSLDDNKGAKLDGPSYLNFMNFDVAGSAVTFDSNSFAPDSASTATSIATGHKTYSGTINMSEDYKTAYETIAEQVHEQKGMSVGVISSVNLNHATPAAFYAHQASRSNYYEIGLELIDSGFEYFAGGGLLKPTGSDGKQADLYTLAEDAGYNVVKTQDEAEKVSEGPVIIIDEPLGDGDAMAYELDRTDDMWSLADHVEKGIEVMEDDKDGFFMMCEGGKIDWACHANDTAASIHDVLEMSNAVQVAVDFYNQHPNDTLILVTADHETGGMTIGFTTTNYDTYLTNLTKQTMSFVKFDSIIDTLRAQGASFEAAMAEAKKAFGLITANDADAANPEYENLILTDYELEGLRTAYERSMTVGAAGQGDMTQRDYELYGTYQPFSVELCHVLNHKSGMDHTTWSHTGAPVNLYAIGAGSDKFTGAFDNTEIFHKLAELTNVQ